MEEEPKGRNGLRRVVFLDLITDRVRTRLSVVLAILCVLLAVSQDTFTLFLVDPRVERGDKTAPAAVRALRRPAEDITVRGAVAASLFSSSAGVNGTISGGVSVVVRNARGYAVPDAVVVAEVVAAEAVTIESGDELRTPMPVDCSGVNAFAGESLASLLGLRNDGDGEDEEGTSESAASGASSNATAVDRDIRPGLGSPRNYAGLPLDTLRNLAVCRPVLTGAAAVTDGSGTAVFDGLGFASASPGVYKIAFRVLEPDSPHRETAMELASEGPGGRPSDLALRLALDPLVTRTGFGYIPGDAAYYETTVTVSSDVGRIDLVGASALWRTDPAPAFGAAVPAVTVLVQRVFDQDTDFERLEPVRNALVRAAFVSTPPTTSLESDTWEPDYDDRKTFIQRVEGSWAITDEKGVATFDKLVIEAGNSLYQSLVFVADGVVIRPRGLGTHVIFSTNVGSISFAEGSPLSPGSANVTLTEGTVLPGQPSVVVKGTDGRPISGKRCFATVTVFSGSTRPPYFLFIEESYKGFEKPVVSAVSEPSDSSGVARFRGLGFSGSGVPSQNSSDPFVLRFDCDGVKGPTSSPIHVTTSVKRVNVRWTVPAEFTLGEIQDTLPVVEILDGENESLQGKFVRLELVPAATGTQTSPALPAGFVTQAAGASDTTGLSSLLFLRFNSLGKFKARFNVDGVRSELTTEFQVKAADKSIPSATARRSGIIPSSRGINNNNAPAGLKRRAAAAGGKNSRGLTGRDEAIARQLVEASRNARAAVRVERRLSPINTSPVLSASAAKKKSRNQFSARQDDDDDDDDEDDDEGLNPNDCIQIEFLKLPAPSTVGATATVVVKATKIDGNPVPEGTVLQLHPSIFVVFPVTFVGFLPDGSLTVLSAFAATDEDGIATFTVFFIAGLDSTVALAVSNIKKNILSDGATDDITCYRELSVEVTNPAVDIRIVSLMGKALSEADREKRQHSLDLVDGTTVRISAAVVDKNEKPVLRTAEGSCFVASAPAWVGSSEAQYSAYTQYISDRSTGGDEVVDEDTGVISWDFTIPPGTPGSFLIGLRVSGLTGASITLRLKSRAASLRVVDQPRTSDGSPPLPSVPFAQQPSVLISDSNGNPVQGYRVAARVKDVGTPNNAIVLTVVDDEEVNEYLDGGWGSRWSRPSDASGVARFGSLAMLGMIPNDAGGYALEFTVFDDAPVSAARALPSGHNDFDGTVISVRQATPAKLTTVSAIVPAGGTTRTRIFIVNPGSNVISSGAKFAKPIVAVVLDSNEDVVKGSGMVVRVVSADGNSSSAAISPITVNSVQQGSLSTGLVTFTSFMIISPPAEVMLEFLAPGAPPILKGPYTITAEPATVTITKEPPASVVVGEVFTVSARLNIASGSPLPGVRAFLTIDGGGTKTRARLVASRAVAVSKSDGSVSFRAVLQSGQPGEYRFVVAVGSVKSLKTIRVAVTNNVRRVQFLRQPRVNTEGGFAKVIVAEPGSNVGADSIVGPLLNVSGADGIPMVSRQAQVEVVVGGGKSPSAFIDPTLRTGADGTLDTTGMYIASGLRADEYRLRFIVDGIESEPSEPFPVENRLQPNSEALGSFEGTAFLFLLLAIPLFAAGSLWTHSLWVLPGVAISLFLMVIAYNRDDIPDLFTRDVDPFVSVLRFFFCIAALLQLILSVALAVGVLVEFLRGKKGKETSGGGSGDDSTSRTGETEGKEMEAWVEKKGNGENDGTGSAKDNGASSSSSASASASTGFSLWFATGRREASERNVKVLLMSERRLRKAAKADPDLKKVGKELDKYDEAVAKYKEWHEKKVKDDLARNRVKKAYEQDKITAKQTGAEPPAPPPKESMRAKVKRLTASAPPYPTTGNIYQNVNMGFRYPQRFLLAFGVSLFLILLATMFCAILVLKAGLLVEIAMNAVIDGQIAVADAAQGDAASSLVTGVSSSLSVADDVAFVSVTDLTKATAAVANAIDPNPAAASPGDVETAGQIKAALGTERYTALAQTVTNMRQASTKAEEAVDGIAAAANKAIVAAGGTGTGGNSDGLEQVRGLVGRFLDTGITYDALAYLRDSLHASGWVALTLGLCSITVVWAVLFIRYPKHAVAIRQANYPFPRKGLTFYDAASYVGVQAAHSGVSVILVFFVFWIIWFILLYTPIRYALWHALWPIVLTLLSVSLVVTILMPIIYKKVLTNPATLDIRWRSVLTFAEAAVTLLGIVSGIGQALVRLSGLIIGLLAFYPLLDVPLTPHGLTDKDKGFKAFHSSLRIDTVWNGPVVTTAMAVWFGIGDDAGASIGKGGKGNDDGKEKDIEAARNDPVARSPAWTRARNRWCLWYTLVNNPTLRRMRRPGPHALSETNEEFEEVWKARCAACGSPDEGDNDKNDKNDKDGNDNATNSGSGSSRKKAMPVISPPPRPAEIPPLPKLVEE